MHLELVTELRKKELPENAMLRLKQEAFMQYKKAGYPILIMDDLEFTYEFEDGKIKAKAEFVERYGKM